LPTCLSVSAKTTKRLPKARAASNLLEVIQVRGAGVGHANEVKKEPNKGAFTSTTQPNEVGSVGGQHDPERRITEADEYIYQTLITLSRFLEKSHNL